MKKPTEGAPGVRATKQRGSLGLLLMLVVVFGGAIGARLLHGAQSKPMADEDDDGVAQAALTAKVAHLAPADQLAALRQALQDTDAGVREAAVDSLAKMRSPQATDAVEAAFQDSASTVREAALEALPNMDRERGLRLELAAFDDDDLWIRESIASKVSADLHHTLFDRRSIPTLVRALDDSSPVVQTLSMSVLRRLTGKSWRVSSKAPDAERSAVILQWKQWWQAAEMTYHLPHEFDSIAARHSTRSDPAPDFHLTDTAGNPADLSSERGKIVLLNFWGTWCPPCKKETPDLIRLDADCRSKGVDIIGVALSEKGGLDLFRKTCAERGILFRQAMATDAILSSRT